MSEILVEEYRARFNLPLVIVRPSIVTGSYHEPFRGWIDTFNGVAGVANEIGRGSVGSLFAKPSCMMDIVPLDLVCNMILVAAWFDALKP